MQTTEALAYTWNVSAFGWHLLKVNDLFTFLGNALGFIGSAGKSIFDVWCNEKMYTKQLGNSVEEPDAPTDNPEVVALRRIRDAKENRKKRADQATIAAFAVLSLGFFLAMLAVTEF